MIEIASLAAFFPLDFAAMSQKGLIRRNSWEKKCILYKNVNEAIVLQMGVTRKIWFNLDFEKEKNSGKHET